MISRDPPPSACHVRRSIHGVLLLVSIFAAIPAGGSLVEHAAQPSLHPCTIEGEAARCGDIPVPENYGEPGGRRIALHAVVLGGGNRGEGREPIFVLAGGPGQAATTLTQGASGIFRSVRRTRDVVLIDQRGTGGANRLDCARAPRSPLVPADVGGCVARLSQDATLRYYGTDSFLEDLEGTRKALGYDRIVLFGLSYGTRAAYAYARRYPQSVRAVVLVGPAPVSMRLLDSVEEDGRRSLDAIVADCLGDQRCSQAFPNVAKDAEHFRTSVSDPFRLLGLQTLQYSANTAVLIPTLLKSAAAGDFSPLDSAVAGLREEYLHRPRPAGAGPALDDRLRRRSAIRRTRYYFSAARRVCASMPRVAGGARGHQFPRTCATFHAGAPARRRMGSGDVAATGARRGRPVLTESSRRISQGGSRVARFRRVRRRAGCRLPRRRSD